MGGGPLDEGVGSWDSLLILLVGYIIGVFIAKIHNKGTNKTRGELLAEGIWWTLLVTPILMFTGLAEFIVR